MKKIAGQDGLTAIELALALGVVAIVLLAALLSPSLGVQAGLTGIAILVNLRPGKR